MSTYRLVLAGIAAATVIALADPVAAADLPLPESAAQAQNTAPAECGPCGCVTVTYDYHRELRSTYGAGFDPRNTDETQPHYYFGPPRAFPRYFVDGVPVPGPCY